MTILQRSEDWHADRCGKVTASRIKDVDAKPIKGKAHNALTLTILTERLTGVQEETKTTGPMQWLLNHLGDGELAFLVKKVLDNNDISF